MNNFFGKLFVIGIMWLLIIVVAAIFLGAAWLMERMRQRMITRIPRPLTERGKAGLQVLQFTRFFILLWSSILVGGALYLLALVAIDTLRGDFP
jgi:hypothetical protein